MFSLLLFTALVAFCTEVSGAPEPEKPFNEWGTYYVHGMGVEDYIHDFNDALRKYEINRNGGEVPDCTKDSNNFSRLNRYYKSNITGNILFSYSCTGEAQEYEHLEVKKGSDGSFTVPVRFGKSLRDFNITGEHRYEKNMRTDKQALQLLNPMFSSIRKDLNNEDCPGNYSMETDHNLFTKFENDLNYYKFNVACLDENKEPSRFFKVEVAVDETKYYNHGNPILVGWQKGTYANTDYLRSGAGASTLSITVTSIILSVLACAIHL